MHKNINDKLAAYEICKQIKFQLYTLSNKFLVTRKTTKVFMFSFLPICLQAISSQNLSIPSFCHPNFCTQCSSLHIRMALNNDGRQETRLVQNLQMRKHVFYKNNNRTKEFPIIN